MGLTKYTTAAALVPEPGAVEDDMAIGIAEIPAVLFRLTRNQKECIIVLVYRVAGKTVAIMETALFSTTYKFMCSILVWFSCIRRRSYYGYEYGFRRNRFTSSQIFSKDMTTVQHHIRYLRISGKPMTQFGKRFCIILLMSLVCSRNWLV